MPPTLWTLLDSVFATYADAWIAGALAGLSACALVFAVVGRADSSRPRCRQCRADASGRAWRDDKHCACGNDLGAPGGVRTPRVRGRRAFIVAAILLVASGAVSTIGINALVRGSSWIDVVPLRWLIAAADDANSVEAFNSTVRRLSDNPSPETCRTLLRDLLDAPLARHDDPDRRDFLIDRCLAASLREPGTPSDLLTRAFDHRVASAAWASTQFSRVNPLLPKVAQTALLFRHDDGMETEGSYLLRVDEVLLGNDEIVVRRSATTEDPPTDRWISLGSTRASRLFELAQPVPVGATLTVRATVAHVPLPAGVALRSLTDAGESPEAALAAIGATLGSVTHTVTVQALAWSEPRSLFFRSPIRVSSGVAPLRERFGHALVPFVSAALGGIVAGVLAAIALLVAWHWPPLRGNLVLTPPSCRRCKSMLKARADALPDRCPECGADLNSSFAVRWIRRRRTLKTTLVAGLPLAALGVTGASLAGAAVATFSARPLLRTFCDPRREIRSSLAALFSTDPAVRESARMDISWLMSGWVRSIPYYPFDRSPAMPALTIAADELLVAAGDPSAAPPETLGALQTMAQLISTLRNRGLLSNEEFTRVTHAFLEPPSRLSATAWRRPGDSFSACVAAPDDTLLVAVEQAADPESSATALGVMPLWSMAGAVCVRGLSAPATPGLAWVPIRWTYISDMKSAKAGSTDAEVEIHPDILAHKGADPRTLQLPIVVTDESRPATLTDADLRVLDPTEALERHMRLRLRAVGTRTLVVPLDCAVPASVAPLGTRVALEIHDGTDWRSLDGPSVVSLATHRSTIRVRTQLRPTDSPLYVASDPATNALISALPNERAFEPVGTYVDEDGLRWDEYRCTTTQEVNAR